MNESQAKVGIDQSTLEWESRSVPVDLSRYNPGQFDRGAGVLKEGLWLVVSLFLFRLCPFGFSTLKCAVLRAFGASVGRNVIIKPQVKITFPWKLTVGNDVWLGEECWLLNLERVVIGSNVCISQRAVLCTGSHDYKRRTFDLITRSIKLEDGVWWVPQPLKLWLQMEFSVAIPPCLINSALFHDTSFGNQNKLWPFLKICPAWRPCVCLDSRQIHASDTPS